MIKRFKREIKNFLYEYFLIEKAVLNPEIKKAKV